MFVFVFFARVVFLVCFWFLGFCLCSVFFFCSLGFCGLGKVLFLFSCGMHGVVVVWLLRTVSYI